MTESTDCRFGPDRRAEWCAFRWFAWVVGQVSRHELDLEGDLRALGQDHSVSHGQQQRDKRSMLVRGENKLDQLAHS